MNKKGTEMFCSVDDILSRTAVYGRELLRRRRFYNNDQKDQLWFFLYSLGVQPLSWRNLRMK